MWFYKRTGISVHCTFFVSVCVSVCDFMSNIVDNMGAIDF